MSRRSLPLLIVALVFSFPCFAQDASTGAIRITVEDPAGSRIAGAAITVTHTTTGVHRGFLSDPDGVFTVQLLPPGEYAVRVEAAGMSPQVTSGVLVQLGGLTEIAARLTLAGVAETVMVAAPAGMVETQSSAVSSVVEEQEITDLPLNGRRFADLALLLPGVAQDPRGLTSASNGDLAFGGVRDWQSSYLVDGADNNNAFFAQARGRYRAPYQFSNEVVQEFRVSSNTYGAELGRAGGAVINVVTKSGSNQFHGTAFYYLRDSSFNARHPFVDFKPADRQHQLGGTFGGPLKKDRAFFLAGFDQHIFHVPTVVRFLTGYTQLVPNVGDFELSDYSLVLAAARSLSSMGGQFRSELLGNAGFLKLDYTLTPRHQFSARLSTSRYYGENNVFFDPASPVTTFAISENGEEDVATESGVVSLTSGLSSRFTSHLRAQFSRDLQESTANASFPRVRIREVIDGFGRSSILPRRTREHKVHLTETLALEGRRHSFKFGGDMLRTWISNFFPSLYGGEYIFDDIRVDPWTFEPQTYGMRITPLRAYAHVVPRYYLQNFGAAVSHPDSNDYAAFAQDTIRATSRLALSFGVRYDFQNFRDDTLVSNPYWPDSGRVPVDRNNFAPRAGFAWSLGDRRPLVIRGGYGWFYPRIPSIYTSTIETNNGLRNSHLLLDNADFYDQQIFPRYPNSLVTCPPSATTCTPPASVASGLTTEVSAFARNFQTPYVQQASLSLEREVAERTAVSANYLYVHGQHLIRARDANLPQPTTLGYPVFDETGTNFLGDYYTVNSFSTWQMTPSLSCAFPPCINDIARPVPELGAVTVFESAASSVYHALTISARRRMARGFSFRLAYTWARATDDGQDALVVGRPATVQNSYSPGSERGLSVTDQRHRFVAAWTAEPQPFHQDHSNLKLLFNDWRFSGVVTSGR